MKHVYLIMAHNEPEVLRHLIMTLDDVRNDIYIHIDSKATFDGQELYTTNAGLYILNERLDARWGDVSLIEVEYLLFETAHNNGEYSYYHLISGVDLPIKSQDYIHDFCKQNEGKEFIGFVPDQYAQKELRTKVGIYHLFPRQFKSSSFMIRLFRNIAKQIQLLCGVNRNSKVVFKKGCQWCSITHSLVEYLVLNKEYILSLYSYTYCPDEIFIPTACWNSPYRKNVYDISNGYISSKRYVHWLNDDLLPIEEDDLPKIMSSDSWFARKFSAENYEVLKKMLKINTLHNCRI